MKRLAALLLVVASLGCHKTVNPLAPSGTDVTGRWTGTASDALGSYPMTLQLAQVGTNVLATIDLHESTYVQAVEPSGAGTVSGASVLLSWFFFASCTANAPATAVSCSASESVNGSKMTGSFQCSASCSVLSSSGSSSLTKQ